MNRDSGRSLGPISSGLAEVLFRASTLNQLRGKTFDLSSSSTFLSFLISRTPWGAWLKMYMDSRGIPVDALLSTRSIGIELLSRAAEMAPEFEERTWKPTDYTDMLLDEAQKLQLAISSPRILLDERHLLAAYIYRSKGDREERLARWGFEKVDWSNSFLSEVRAQNKEELEAWKQIHLETFSVEPDLPAEAQQSTETKDEPPASPDQTQVLLDGPAIQDMLGRKYLAETLAVRMNRTWQRYRDQALKGSFMLHIHGPWGSGKSSLLNFLKTELQPRSKEQKLNKPNAIVDEASLDWIVVDFNAWQRQHVEPPWWSLLDTLYTQACIQLRNSYGKRLQAWALQVKEKWWRITTGRREHLTALVIFSFVMLAALLFWRYRAPTQGMDFDFKSVAAVVGVVGTLWSTLLLMSRSLLSGSSQSAQAFMQRSGDPMERVSKHFVELLGWINRPVVIFVDDLDRCQTTYVVTLLEGIQTLFNNPRAVYVIAADRRWLNASFEKSYENFADAVKEPGRRLGSLFLEKAFEASISVPRMSPQRRRLYWDHLGSVTPPAAQELESATVEFQNEFKNDKTEADVLSRLSKPTGDPFRDEIRKGAAVRQLANQNVAESTDYFLKPFGDLAEPNARAMKRLVNGYTLLRDMAVLGGSDLLFDLNVRRQLALWAIVSLRWPLLKEYLEDRLEQNPDEDPDIIKLICDQSTIPALTTEIEHLVKSREVVRVFNGHGMGTKLDKETICSLVGISAAQPKSGGVA